MQHRIFLVSLRGDVDLGWAGTHWRERHGTLFRGTPELLRYQQNRPLVEATDRIVCSETWFASREAERRGFGSAHYSDTVAPDEARFLNRDTVWAGRVLTPAGSTAPTAPFSVLWFGAESLPERIEGRWTELTVDREVPGPGTGTVVRRGWFDDEEAARGLTAAVVTTVVCRPAIFGALEQTVVDRRSAVSERERQQ